MKHVVTLDGPAASGKSTIAKRIAARLRVPFVSSGLLYRAAAWLALAAGADVHGEQRIVSLLRQHRVRIVPGLDGNRVEIDNIDRSHELHTDDVDDAVSAVASRPAVRAWVNERLREIEGPFVIDGRDMGRDVFPEAVCKVFLTARPGVRAARRVGERSGDLQAVTDAIRARDEADALQSRPANDAVTVDTSELDLDQVEDRVWQLVEARVRAPRT